MSICVLAERYGVKGQTPRKQYKEKISDYRNWDQLEHAHDYLLYPENIGENLSLDETCLSNGDVYTILTNKAAKGRKGALVAMVRGVATDAVSGILRRLPHRKRLSVKTVTTDLSELVHVTDLSVALLGKTVAVSVSLSPISKVKDVLLSDTEVTSITSGAGSLTVTVQDAVLPLCASAVIVVVPSDLAVTFPSLTAATEEFVLDHVMLLSVALLGETVTTSV